MCLGLKGSQTSMASQPHRELPPAATYWQHFGVTVFKMLSFPLLTHIFTYLHTYLLLHLRLTRVRAKYCVAAPCVLSLLTQNSYVCNLLLMTAPIISFCVRLYNRTSMSTGPTYIQTGLLWHAHYSCVTAAGLAYVTVHRNDCNNSNRRFSSIVPQVAPPSNPGLARPCKQK